MSKLLYYISKLLYYLVIALHVPNSAAYLGMLLFYDTTVLVYDSATVLHVPSPEAYLIRASPQGRGAVNAPTQAQTHRTGW